MKKMKKVQLVSLALALCSHVNASYQNIDRAQLAAFGILKNGSTKEIKIGEQSDTKSDAERFKKAHEKERREYGEK